MALRVWPDWGAMQKVRRRDTPRESRWAALELYEISQMRQSFCSAKPEAMSVDKSWLLMALHGDAREPSAWELRLAWSIRIIFSTESSQRTCEIQERTERPS